MSTNSSILAINHNHQNLQLLAQFLEREGYPIVRVSRLESFEDVLNQTVTFGMALVDLSGFDRRIWDCCEQLRSQQIPFLVLSPKPSNTLQQKSLSHGARRMLVKPLIVRELLLIITSIINKSN
ncbi:MAG: two-component system response regulator [Actinomycetota bacterium]